MIRPRKLYLCLSAILAVTTLLLTACSDSGEKKTPAHTYSATSNRGDYSEWVFDGDKLSTQWEVINDTGAVDVTLKLNANCGAPDQFAVRQCTITSSSCISGARICEGDLSGAFKTIEVPGIALLIFVGIPDFEQIHVGINKDRLACASDISGDYTFMRTGLGLDENFGLFRSDGNAVKILHADFGFATPDQNTNQSVVYRTGTESETLTDAGCSEGVRTRINPENSIIRSMITASGLFIMDLPAGQGGLVSFKTTLAASLPDFAGKHFSGISFPDNAPAQFIKVDFGAVNGSRVEFSGTSSAGESINADIKALASAASSTLPNYPDFQLQPDGYDLAALAASYPNPASIPGLFKLDGLSDDGRVIVAAMKFQGKVFAVGMVYNLRTTADTNPATDVPFDADGLYNTGNFILFEAP